MARNKKSTKSGRLRLVGYARVSTEEQAREGISMHAQRERLEAYCTAHNYDLIAFETDNGVSGKIPPAKRPGLARALALVSKGEADGLLALKLDRLSRRTRDVLDLVDDSRRGGWRLISVSEQLDTGSAAGRLVVTVLAALAEMEREQAAERTRFALDAIARQGRARSRFVPFGYRTAAGGTEQTKGDRKAMVPYPAEQRVLRRLRKLRKKGMGARTIARALEAEGLKNPRSGSPWTPSNVGSILRTLERRDEALA